MSRNQEVIDTKPKNNLVIDSRPLNSQVLDSKPKMINTMQPIETEQFYSVTVNAGQSMGLLLALTYKEGFTVTSSKAP